jgi:hypothetical protein
MPFSPSPASLNNRQLISPSAHIPWSVDVISAVPKSVVELLAKGNIAASASCPGWACLCQQDGFVYVWQDTSTLLFNEKMVPAKALKVFFPDLLGETNITLGLIATHHGECVNVYALTPMYLILRKLSAKDWTARQTLRAYTAKLRLILEHPKEVPLTLTCQPTSNHPSRLLVVLATNKQNLYYIHHTAVPVGMQLQKITSPKSGLWGRFFSSSPGALDYQITQQEPPQWVLPTVTSTSASDKEQNRSFWAISPSSLTMWKIQSPTSFEIVLQHARWGSTEFLIQTILQASLLENEKVHCIVKGTPILSTPGQKGEAKLYWLVIDLQTGIIEKSHWLSRFSTVESVDILGLAGTSTGDAYITVSCGGQVIVMVLVEETNLIQEVDLPVAQIPNVIADSTQPDIVTNGCRFVATSGIGLRARCLTPGAGSSPRKRARGGAGNLQSLLSHLRSFFWQSYQDPLLTLGNHSNKPIPPSLTLASTDTLEQVVLTFTTELQQKQQDTSSASNPMDWHKALIQVLQQGGLYKTLSQQVRWQLMGIGQELAVFQVLATSHSKDQLKPFDLTSFLASSAQNTELLALAVTTAAQYRSEMASSFYDILVSANNKDAPSTNALWTSQQSLQRLLLLQLEEWKQPDQQAPLQEHVHAIVQATLLSYSESSHFKFPQVRALAIDLLRRLLKNDELAFELSLEYNYFHGLCQLSIDHQQEQDAALFSLDPLFQQSSSKRDEESGFSWSQYVLQWHTDRGLYGHAINYGRHSPNDLSLLMSQDKRLKPYQWIPAIRQQYYQRATDSFLSIQRDTFQQAQWALSMAKLANKLVAKPIEVQTRTIEEKLELVDAQQILCPSETMLLVPEELVRLALQNLSKTDDLADQVQLALTALAVCASMPSSSSQKVEWTAQIWADCFQLDSQKWQLYIQKDLALTKDEFTQTLVFGVLWNEISQSQDMASVLYARHLESSILDLLHFSNTDRVELTRLLRSVTDEGNIASLSEKMQGQSLVVASY